MACLRIGDRGTEPNAARVLCRNSEPEERIMRERGRIADAEQIVTVRFGNPRGARWRSSRPLHQRTLHAELRSAW